MWSKQTPSCASSSRPYSLFRLEVNYSYFRSFCISITPLVCNLTTSWAMFSRPMSEVANKSPFSSFVCAKFVSLSKKGKGKVPVFLTEHHAMKA